MPEHSSTVLRSEVLAGLRDQVLRRLNAYSKQPIEEIEGYVMLVGREPSTNRGVFIVPGNFGRADFKAAFAEIQAAGLSTHEMCVFGQTATYSGRMIDFTKFEDLGLRS
ncbi:hypothetical protein [Acidovorax sp.]|uniref:hypothetical protein n=1 Tax=Acidovorax sp. TaxID=1872122 RepID=UPI00391F355F